MKNDNLNILKHEHLLFPIYVAQYSNFLNEEQIRDIYSYCINENTMQHPAITGDAKSSHSECSQLISKISKDVKNCEELENILHAISNEYAKSLGLLGEIAISNSWFNLQNEGSVLIDHIHPGSLFSGALYINVDDDSSRLYFKNPNTFLIHLHEQDSNINPDSRNYLSPSYWVKPKAGCLIIFPSWLYHGSSYKENKTTNRTVISFNTQYRNRRT